MLAYAHINLLSMLQRLEPDEAVRVATDSIYVWKSALHKAFVAPKNMTVEGSCACSFYSRKTSLQWFLGGAGTKTSRSSCHRSMRPTSPSQIPSQQQRTSLPAPRHDHLNGGGGSGKTMRAIELFRTKKPLLFTPTHRLARDAGHSFFRWSCQTDWTPERMGQKFKPRVIIWDEVCTVPRPNPETFLDWLEGQGVQVICCGDQGQPPPIAGEMPHDWLREHANYYEEVEVDHRAKDPLLKALKKDIRLQPDRVQCRAMRKALPGCLGWERFVEAWKPCDLILTSRQKVRDRAQRLLFERHEKYFPDTEEPLLHRPKDTRRQNIMVTIPGPLLLDGRPDQEELVLNDVVQEGLKYAREVLDGKWDQDWALGYALTVHSSQVLTVADPQKVWIIDDYLQWSNLAYLAEEGDHTS